MNEQAEMTLTHTEAPVIVYPRQGGGTWYKGIEYSVTLRLGGTAEQALALLIEFDRLGQAEDVSLLPPKYEDQYKSEPPKQSASKMATVPDEPPAKPKSEAPEGVEVDNRGNWPGRELHQTIGYIARKTDGTKVWFELYPAINGQPGQYPQYKVNRDQDIVTLDAALGENVNIYQYDMNKLYPVNLLVTAKVASTKTQKGNYYVNPTSYQVR